MYPISERPSIMEHIAADDRKLQKFAEVLKALNLTLEESRNSYGFNIITTKEAE